MRTYTDFMQLVEQIPHMEPTASSSQRTIQNARASAWHRRHVHRELAQTAQQQQKAKQNLDQFA